MHQYRRKYVKHMTMSPHPSFINIEKYSAIVEDNELFSQYTNEEIPSQLSANFMLLKFSPVLSEFKLLEKMHLDYQRFIEQPHLKITWPENLGLSPEVLDYLDQENYRIGMLNLYWITAKELIAKPWNPQLQLKEVTPASLPEFLSLNFEEDLTYGEDFARNKQLVYRHQYQRPGVAFYLGSIEDTPVASFICNTSDDYVEVDHLLTAHKFRKQQIAQTVLYYIVEKASKNDKTLILVADAEDSVKDMYEKLGFQLAGFQISAEKSISLL